MRVIEPYKRFISLGKHCRPSYQIRRYLGVEAASYFDWLVTPYEALMLALNEGLDALFMLEHLQVTPDECGVQDVKTKICYYHHFSRYGPSNRIQRDRIELDYPAVRAKFDFLSERWKATISDAGTLFIRQDDLTSVQTSELYKALAMQVGHDAFGLLIVGQQREPDIVERPGIHIAFDSADSHSGVTWQGDDDIWNSILEPFAPRKG